MGNKLTCFEHSRRVLVLRSRVIHRHDSGTCRAIDDSPALHIAGRTLSPLDVQTERHYFDGPLAPSSLTPGEGK